MKLIVCVDNKWGIGKNNDLLVRIPEDLKFFHTLTKGNTVLMGKNTALSLPNGLPLKHRKNIVLTSDLSLKNKGFKVISSIDSINSIKRWSWFNDIYVIGGGQLYETLYPQCNAIFVTKVFADLKADTFIHNFDDDENYMVIAQSPIKKYNDLEYQFLVYRKENKK